MRLNTLYEDQNRSANDLPINEGIRDAIASVFSFLKSPRKTLKHVTQMASDSELKRKGEHVLARLDDFPENNLEERFGDHPDFHRYSGLVQKMFNSMVQNSQETVIEEEGTDPVWKALMLTLLGLWGGALLMAAGALNVLPLGMGAGIAGVLYGIKQFVSWAALEAEY